MTVGELINALRGVDEDAEVFLEEGSLNSVSVQEDSVVLSREDYQWSGEASDNYDSDPMLGEEDPYFDELPDPYDPLP